MNRGSLLRGRGRSIVVINYNYINHQICIKEILFQAMKVDISTRLNSNTASTTITSSLSASSFFTSTSAFKSLNQLVLEASDEVSPDRSLSAGVPELNNVGITRDKQMILSRLYATVYKRFGGYFSGM